MGNESADWKLVDRGVEAMLAICDKVLHVMTSHQREPLPDSRAFNEKQSAGQCGTDFLDYAFRQGGLSLMIAVDLGEALGRTLEPGNRQPFAPWACARQILEASSTCIWLLDTEICALARMARSANAQLDDLKYSRQLAKNAGWSEIVSMFDADKERLLQQVDEIEIAQRVKAEKLTISKRIEMIFGDGSIYPMMSRVAHGNRRMSLVLGLGKVAVASPDSADYLAAQWLVQQSTLWLSKSLKSQYELFGWNAAEVEPVLATARNIILEFRWQ